MGQDMNRVYQVDGARLAFRETGSGPAVVFLHPTPLDREYWRPMIENLAGVRAIVPDLRGHGQSELGQNLPSGGFSRVPDAPALTMAQLGTDILALLDHLQVPKLFLPAAQLAAMCCWSYGGGLRSACRGWCLSVPNRSRTRRAT
jgi:pimeloyl-ACP methyl ester carboxylesterase